MMCQGEFTSTLMHVDGLQTKRYCCSKGCRGHVFCCVNNVSVCGVYVCDLQIHCYIISAIFRPEWSQRLNYYRVEASWKLGQWDSLETYLKAVRKSCLEYLNNSLQHTLEYCATSKYRTLPAIGEAAF